MPDNIDGHCICGNCGNCLVREALGDVKRCEGCGVLDVVVPVTDRGWGLMRNELCDACWDDTDDERR